MQSSAALILWVPYFSHILNIFAPWLSDAGDTPEEDEPACVGIEGRVATPRCTMHTQQETAFWVAYETMRLHPKYNILGVTLINTLPLLRKIPTAHSQSTDKLPAETPALSANPMVRDL